MLSSWIIFRYMMTGRRFFNLTTSLGILGMAIGVASLTVVMGVVSGFETTLKRAVIDVTGHVILIKRGGEIETSERIFDLIRDKTDQLVAASPFVYAEAVLAHDQKISGVMVEGADPKQIGKVLRLKRRVIKGKYDLGVRDGVPNALLGKGLVRRFNLSIGDVFQVAVPVAKSDSLMGFRPQLQSLRLVGVMDLGRHEYDERFILTNLKTVQTMAKIGDQITGYRLRIKDEDRAREVAGLIADTLGYPYWTKDWSEANRNLFEAIRLEKPVIFIVIFSMVLAACFNISSVLFVNVLKRFSDISILKTMGASRKFVTRIFTLQGLFIGVLGSLLGFTLGLGLCFLFSWAQTRIQLLPGDIYRLDHVGVELRPFDLLLIFITSVGVCWVSSLAPARKGAKLSAVEGLKYE